MDRIYLDKLKQLKQYAQMQSEEDIKNFELTAWELAETKDIEALKELLGIFYDDCDYPEVMYSLIHAIETYKADIYVKEASKTLDVMLPHAQEWAMRLLYRILNHPTYTSLLRDNLNLANKKALMELFEYMHNDSDRHRPIIEDLRARLNSNS